MNESKQGQSIQLLNELDAMMVPTMLEINFEKPRMKSRLRKVNRAGNRDYKNSATRQTVRTDGLSGSNMGEMISVQGTVAPFRPENVVVDYTKRPISPQVHKIGSIFPNTNPQNTAKEQIIYNINQAFEELKSLFP